LPDGPESKPLVGKAPYEALERPCDRLSEAGNVGFFISGGLEQKVCVDNGAQPSGLSSVAGEDGGNDARSGPEGNAGRQGRHFRRGAEEVDTDAFPGLDDVDEQAEHLVASEAAEHLRHGFLAGNNSHPEAAPEALDKVVHGLEGERLSNDRDGVIAGGKRSSAHLPLTKVEGDKNRAASVTTVGEDRPVVKGHPAADGIRAENGELKEVDNVAAEVAEGLSRRALGGLGVAENWSQVGEEGPPRAAEKKVGEIGQARGDCVGDRGRDQTSGKEQPRPGKPINRDPGDLAHLQANCRREESWQRVGSRKSEVGEMVDEEPTADSRQPRAKGTGRSGRPAGF